MGCSTLFTSKIKERFRFIQNIQEMTLAEKIDHSSSVFPAITHIDYSARIQTVNKASNLKLYILLSKFKEKTGYGIILNTSFNIKDEPIVCSPEDAIRCFKKTGLDLLVLENVLVKKADNNED
ncbi:MAG: hypothetical protein OHK0040_11740 [bacterium]